MFHDIKKKKLLFFGTRISTLFGTDQIKMLLCKQKHSFSMLANSRDTTKNGISGDSFVLTKEGYIQIKDLTSEHLLLSENGEFTKIVKISSFIYTGVLLKVRAKYHPRPILCVPEQEFLIRTKLKAETFTEADYKKAINLTKSDFFGMTVNQKNELPPIFYIQKKINHSRIDIASLDLNEPEMFWILGYFTGDGWVSDTKQRDGRPTYKIEFIVNLKDESIVIPKIQKYLRIRVSKDTVTAKEFKCSNALWFSILKHFGKYSYGKKIPNFIQNAPIQFIQAYVDGYLKADGSCDKRDRKQLCTVSPQLAYGFQLLMFKLGFIYGITLTSRDSILEHKIKNKIVKKQRPMYTVRGVNRKTQMSSFIEKSFVWFLPYEHQIEQHTNICLYEITLENNSFFVVENIIVKS